MEVLSSTTSVAVVVVSPVAEAADVVAALASLKGRVMVIK